MNERSELDDMLALLNQMRWLHSKEMLNANELERLKGELFTGGTAQVKQVLRKLQQMVWLYEQGTLSAEELVHLKQPLLAPVRSVFSPGADPSASPAPLSSSADQPTTKLTPLDERWRYLTVTISTNEAPETTDPAPLQVTLDHYGADGWELAACLPSANCVLLIFKQRDH